MSAAELGSRLRPFLSQAPVTLCVTRDRKQGSTETPGWWPWSPGRNGQSAHLPGTVTVPLSGWVQSHGGSAWGHAHRTDARDPCACAGGGVEKNLTHLEPNFKLGFTVCLPGGLGQGTRFSHL